MGGKSDRQACPCPERIRRTKKVNPLFQSPLLKKMGSKYTKHNETRNITAVKDNRILFLLRSPSRSLPSLTFMISPLT
jgi:hypothetical protein